METTFDPGLEADIRDVMNEVPLPVRAYIRSGGIEDVTRSLMRAHNLHVDQAAVLEREIALLLLGLNSPSEFMETLSREGIDRPTIEAITKEVNERIFIPIRDEMRRGASGNQVPPSPRYGPPAPPSAAMPPPRGGAPLPPRHILPTPGTPIFHRPMPPSPAQPMVPMNLPTGVPPAPRPAPTESFYEFPPLARPVPPPISSVPDGETPHTRYSSDPYREPPEGV